MTMLGFLSTTASIPYTVTGIVFVILLMGLTCHPRVISYLDTLHEEAWNGVGLFLCCLMLVLGIALAYTIAHYLYYDLGAGL